MVFLILCLNLLVNTSTEWRELHQRAHKDEKAANTLVERLEKKEKRSGLEDAYLACGYFFQAHHAFNPVRKYNCFVKGKGLFRSALKKDPENLEIRFLRFANQVEIPTFLNYKQNIDEDRDFLLKHLGTTPDDALKKWVVDYLKKCQCLSEAELALVKGM
jgi:hypothetical protein